MTHHTKRALLGAAAFLALGACGGGDDATKSSTIKVDQAPSASAASPLDAPFRLQNAAALDMPAFLAAAGMEDLTYATASFDESIGATVLTNVKPAADGKTTIGRMELYGVNQAAFAQLEQDQPLEEMTELFRLVRLFDVQTDFELPNQMGPDVESTPTAGKITIGAVELGTLKLRTTEDTAADDAEEEGDFNFGNNQVEFGGMSFKDIDMSMPMEDGTSGITMSSPDLRIGAYRNGHFAGVFARDLDYTVLQSEEQINQGLAALGPQVQMLANNPFLRGLFFPTQQRQRIGELSWDGMQFEKLLPYFRAQEKPPISETDLLSVGKMVINDQEVWVNGKKAATTATTVMEPISFYHLMPREISIVSTGAKIDYTAYVQDETSDVAKILRDNGLDDIEGDARMNFAFDPKAKSVTLSAIGESDDFYDMSMSVALANFDYDTIVGSDDQATTQAATLDTALRGFELKIKDEKLLDTVFAVLGSVQGQDPAQLRQVVNSYLTIGAMQGAQFSPRVPAYATALTKFVNEGGTLTIKAEPKKPVPASALAAAGSEGNPGAVLDTINLTVTTD